MRTMRDPPRTRARVHRGQGHPYLARGRIDVIEVTDDTIRATCRGDTGSYELGHHGDWHCDCPARVRLCSHLIALRLVTVRNVEVPV